MRWRKGNWKRDRWNAKKRGMSERVREEMSPKSRFNILESQSFSQLFNVLIRRENAAHRLPTAQSLGRKKDGEWERKES